MPKWVFVVIGVVIIGGLGAWFISNNTVQTDYTQSVIDNDYSATPAPITENSRYVEYSPEKFSSVTNTRRVLFFYAPWCPTCRPADAQFQANMDKIPSDVTLLRADYDSEKQLKQRYGVTYQHTFVQVDSQGNLVTKWNGGDIATLLDNLK